MKKRSLSTIILILAFFVGLSLLLYPSFSDYWNSQHQTQVIAEYDEQVEKLDEDRYEQLWADAHRYNEALPKKADRYELSEEEKAEYEKQLNVTGSGVIGYIEIPLIGCNLPIYHGTDETVLQIAIGHIEGTSLPVGGAGTHCVLSGHRGLPSAQLFSDLDQLSVGDTFSLRILDQVLTYEVDRILIVEPRNLNPLEIEPDKDYCTLVTCTPYGINTHRLLVRGHQIKTEKEAKGIRAPADAVQIEPMLVAPLVAVPIVFVLLTAMMISTGKKQNNRRRTV